MWAVLKRCAGLSLSLSLALASPAGTAAPPPPAAVDLPPGAGQLKAEVMAVERAFAATMARRDLAGFTSFLSEEAIFFSGPGKPVLRGRAAIAEAWARFYQGPTAPFSWEPERVEVIDSGSLALSSGPVRDPQGKQIATFNSIWRRDRDGRFRILFDKGEAVCAGTEASPNGNPADPLSELDPYVATALSAWNAPGVAIAIVKDGRVLLTRGYGRRQLGGGGLVDAHTRFALASLTKGFTAALASQQVAEGRLSLDQPIAARLPGFALADPRVTAELSLRDILSHRSGLAESAELLWPGTGYDSDELISRLRFVEQAAPLRTQFSYSNVLYVVAGKLVTAAAGRPFAEVLKTRLLDPAGLRDSGLGLPQANDDNFARPHAEQDGTLRVIAPRTVDNIAPAAALYSSAHDLARWLLLLLGRGKLDGQQLIPEAGVSAMLSPQMLVGLAPWQQALYPESHFLAQGLGFMLQDYRGELVAWGTGGIDGSSCSLALVPGRGLGIAVLANVPWTGLPEGLLFHIVDRALGVRGRDFSALRLALSLSSRARHAEALRQQLGPQISTAFPVPRARLVGRYHSPLLGDAWIVEPTEPTTGPGAGALLLRIGKTWQAWLDPWRPDALRVRPIDRQLDPQLCKLRVAADGTVVGIQLDDHGAFERVADRPQRAAPPPDTTTPVADPARRATVIQRASHGAHPLRSSSAPPRPADPRR
ncbi:MAG TPA: class A beta-lactamase-related serine hydrolase [Pseudomonadota bacterium]|nr:class A beta-lactamase-related serine hydrolase [Pseudomonadota bacterium]